MATAARWRSDDCISRRCVDAGSEQQALALLERSDMRLPAEAQRAPLQEEIEHKQQVLPPQHYLRMLQDGSLPAAVPDVPQRTTLKHALHKGASESRGKVGKETATSAAALTSRVPAAEVADEDYEDAGAESYAQQELRRRRPRARRRCDGDAAAAAD